MLWLPTIREEIFALAVPPESVTALPMFDPSALNCTLPVGVPAPGDDALTVAVNVTDCPKADGLLFETRFVAEFDLFTTCVKIDDVLVLKFPSAL